MNPRILFLTCYLYYEWVLFLPDWADFFIPWVALICVILYFADTPLTLGGHHGAET
jgi:hypothetical protein